MQEYSPNKNFNQLFIAIGLLGILIIFSQCKSTREETKRPNFIIIFADDLGYGDLSCYGHPTIHTPYLDKMASEGMRFTQFYSGASVCTPSRAALLTGRLPIRYGLSSPRMRVFFPWSISGLPHEETTIAELLKEEGYSTGIFGKWHLGHLPEYLPMQHGFDEYFGIPYSNDMSTAYTSWKGASLFPPTPLIDGNEVIEEEPDQSKLTRLYTERSVDFIKRNKNNPFFLYLPHTFPHVPLFASEQFEGSSKRGLYGDVVEEIDWSVGQILKTLQEEGLDENTLVIFTSDNGPWLTENEEGGSAGLLHQGKGSTYEGGMREPMIARWKGMIPEGVVTHSLATTMDFLPTLAHLSNTKYDGSIGEDGKDISSILFGKSDQVRDEVFYYLGDELFAYRKGPYKIHFKTLNPYIGEQPQSHNPPLLYNLEIDPSERFNLSSENPEIIERLIKESEMHIQGVEKVEDQLIKVDSVMFAPVLQN